MAWSNGVSTDGITPMECSNCIHFTCYVSLIRLRPTKLALALLNFLAHINRHNTRNLEILPTKPQPSPRPSPHVTRPEVGLGGHICRGCSQDAVEHVGMQREGGVFELEFEHDKAAAVAREVGWYVWTYLL
jgi:hypothetical protein